MQDLIVFTSFSAKIFIYDIVDCWYSKLSFEIVRCEKLDVLILYMNEFIIYIK